MLKGKNQVTRSVRLEPQLDQMLQGAANRQQKSKNSILNEALTHGLLFEPGRLILTDVGFSIDTYGTEKFYDTVRPLFGTFTTAIINDYRLAKDRLELIDDRNRSLKLSEVTAGYDGTGPLTMRDILRKANFHEDDIQRIFDPAITYPYIIENRGTDDGH